MRENEKDQEMQALLDSLLENYSAVEPRPGLETRIRAQLRARGVERRRVWMLAVAASAAVLLFAALLMARRNSSVSTPVSTVAHDAIGDHTVSPVKDPAPPSFTRARPQLKPVAARSDTSSQSRTAAILQLANAIRSNDRPEESEDQSEPPAPRDFDANRPGSTNQISIQNLDVDSIEIKELAPPRSDEKGNL